MFALLLLDRESHDPMALAGALAAIRETPVQDQVLSAKRAWGILSERLTEAEARSLGQALRAAGVACTVGPASSLVELPALEVVRTFDDLPDAQPVLISVAGLTVTTTTTKTAPQGPSGVQKVAGAAIMMTTGLPIKVGGKKKPVQKTQEEQSLAFVADLHYAGPARRLRIDASHFDFSCLAQRMLYQAQANLKLLVGDVVEAAPEAWMNHGARVLLEGRPIRTMGYGSLEDFEREARWLLTLRSFGE